MARSRNPTGTRRDFSRHLVMSSEASSNCEAAGRIVILSETKRSRRTRHLLLYCFNCKHQAVRDSSTTLRFARNDKGGLHGCSHSFGNCNPEQIEPALQNACSQSAERESRAARRLFGFQDRTRFVEGVEAVRRFEQVVRQNVRPEIVQDCRHHFGELAQAPGEFSFGWFCEKDCSVVLVRRGTPRPTLLPEGEGTPSP